MAVKVLPLRLRFHVVRIVKDDSTLFQRAHVALIRVLVKCQKHVRLIARAQDFARTDPNLKNGRAPGNRRGDRHERHDLLLAAAGKPRQETADGLNAVLRVAGDADDRLGNF